MNRDWPCLDLVLVSMFMCVVPGSHIYTYLSTKPRQGWAFTMTCSCFGACQSNRSNAIFLKMSLSIHSIYRQIFKIWREKRFKLFLELGKPSASDILLDVGGYPGFWVLHHQPVRRVDALNVHEFPWNSKDFPDHNIRVLIGDGCSLAMPDKGYDIGFSNSVIEHVGSWERQRQFASELRRVAKVL